MNKLFFGFFILMLSVQPLSCDNVGKAHTSAVSDSSTEFAWAAGAVSLATIAILVGVVASSAAEDANGEWSFPFHNVPYIPPYTP